MNPPSLVHFQVVAIGLFVLGFFTVATRQHAIAILMCIELILNGANVNFVAFARFGAVAWPVAGHVLVVASIMVAAAEVAIALAIVLAVFRAFHTIDTTVTTELRE